MIPFVDLQMQARSLEPELNEAWRNLLTNCDFILGAAVGRFEQAFAEFVGARHAVGVASGVDALRLGLSVVGVGPGDEVILPANTFIATALAVSAVGARPVLVDCDERTYNLDVAQTAAAVTPRTKAIVPVHLCGQPADMDGVQTIARRHGLAVVEDACQAHGAKYRGKSCGTLGNVGCFSFYPGKNLGAFGDGGLITTDDAALAERLRRLRNYGQEIKYHHVEEGLNSRLDTLQAAVLEVKLKRLAEWNAARRRRADDYRRLLTGVGDLRFQQTLPDAEHVYHLFIVETDRRDALQKHLTAAGVQTGIHYPLPIHLQPAYAGLKHQVGAFPVCERLAKRILSLPMFPELSESQVAQVAEKLVEYFV